MGKLIIDGIEFKFNSLYKEGIETDEIEAFMFSGNKLLTYVEMENIKVINLDGFSRCHNLIEAIFKNVRVIGDGVFSFCDKLTKIEVPNAISLGFGFFLKSGIESIVLNDEILEIESYAFISCLKLKNIKLPTNLERIRNNTFYASGSLIITSLPETLEEIGEYAFSYTKISIKHLPKKVSIIPKSCFSNCSALRDLTLGDKGYPIISIGEYAFGSCIWLTNLTIYTTGGQALAGAPWGATNATITYLPA